MSERNLELLRKLEEALIEELGLEPWKYYLDEEEGISIEDSMKKWGEEEDLGWIFYRLFWVLYDKEYVDSLEYFNHVFPQLLIISYCSDGEKRGIWKEDLEWIRMDMMLEVCSLIRLNRDVREYIGLQVNFNDSRVAPGSFHEDQPLLVGYMREWLVKLGLRENDIDEGILDKNLLINTLDEYYTIPDEFGVASYLRSKGVMRFRERGKFGVGYFDILDRPVQDTYKLLAVNSLIDQLLSIYDFWEIISDERKVGVVHELVRMGDEIVKGKEELDLFDHIDITDTVVNYHKLSMISSLLLKDNVSDIITHCKRMEICRYGTVKDAALELERVSDKVRFMVFKSCLDGEMQSLSERRVFSFSEEWRGGEKIYDDDGLVPGDKNWSKYNRTRLAGGKMRTYLKKFSTRNSKSGIGVLTREADYMKKKQDHLELYDILGLSTSVQLNRRGRPIDILHPRRNKNRETIISEIDYLPESLKIAISRLNSYSSVLKVPYIYAITMDHLIQYSRCIISIDGIDYERSLSELSQRLRDLTYFMEQMGVVGDFYVLREIFGNVEGLIEGALSENRRGFSVELQQAIKTAFLDVEDSLSFPYAWYDSDDGELQILSMTPSAEEE